MAFQLSEHRDVLLRSLIDDHLSYSFQNTVRLEPTKVPLIIEVLRSQQLLVPQNFPSAFVTAGVPPTADDKENFAILKSHNQSIEKFVAAVERLITSKGKKSFESCFVRSCLTYSLFRYTNKMLWIDHSTGNH